MGDTPYNLRSCAYMEDFYSQKIVYPDIMRMPQDIAMLQTYPYFHFDTESYFIEATNFMITGKNIDLLFLYISSDIGFFIYSKFFAGPQFDNTGFRYKKIYINELLVPKIETLDGDNLRKHLAQLNNTPETASVLVNNIFAKIIGLSDIESEWIKNYKKRLLLS